MKKLLSIVLLSVALFAAPRVGDNAVKFELPDLYAQNISFKSASLKGKVVLLNMWASWCGGCQEEMPLFVELQKEFSKSKFEIVLANIDNEAKNGVDFLSKVDKKRSLTALYDADKILPKAYRCPGMPSSFLIDQNGKVVGVYIGSLDTEAILDLKKTIKKLLGK